MPGSSDAGASDEARPVRDTAPMADLDAVLARELVDGEAVVASLPVISWWPAKAVVVVTDRSRLVVAVADRYPMARAVVVRDVLRVSPVGRVVLREEDGEELMLVVDAAPLSLLAFAGAIGVSRGSSSC